MFGEKFTRIFYHYAVWQDFFKQFPNTSFIQGLPDEGQYDANKTPILIVLDDLFTGVNEVCATLFYRCRHHCNASVIMLTQNIFHNNKYFRAISLNTQYLVLFKSPRDKNQIACLARQIAPAGWRGVLEAYEDSTRKPHSYLVVNVSQSSTAENMLFTNIFPKDGVTSYYHLKG
jgi:hypothetical protein